MLNKKGKNMKKIKELCLIASMLVVPTVTMSCTGLSLTTESGDVVVGRTMEWSHNASLQHKIGIYPRGKKYKALKPENSDGMMKWTGKYGYVGMTTYGLDMGPDGLNEKGLAVAFFYLPGYASYGKYNKETAHQSLTMGDFMKWMLSSFATVKEVKANMDKIRVVSVIDKRFGDADHPLHIKVTDPSGESIIIEVVENGKMKVYDALLGVVTNSPTYDWHLTNLKNYLHLSPKAHEPIQTKDLAFSPLGAGSGMIGLPGDFTPPSRFIRAAAMAATARPLKTTNDAVFELFRMLDNFNIPLGVVLPKEQIPTDIESATQITSVSDLTNITYYYHTMYNRQIRKIDLRKIDFSTVKEQVIDDDTNEEHRVKELLTK